MYIHEKVLASLERAGAAGRTTAELSQEFFGEDSPLARMKLSMMVANLRKKGHKIITIITKPGGKEHIPGTYLLIPKEKT